MISFHNMLLFLLYVHMMTGEKFSDDLEIGTKEVETMIRVQQD